MSILLVQAAANTLAAIPAVGSKAAAMLDAGVFVWLAIALLLATWFGVFRRASINGRNRLAEGESVWGIVIIFFYSAGAAYFLAMLIARLAHLSGQRGQMLLTLILESTAILFVLVGTALYRPNGLRLMGLNLRRLPAGATLGMAAIFTLFPLVMVISDLTLVVWQHFGLHEPPVHEALQDMQSGDKRLKIMAIAAAAVIAPLGEEIAFRGFLQTILVRLFGRATSPLTARWAAVILTAACFAAVHGVPVFVPPLFVLALGLGYLYERFGNLWATITMHSLFNIIQIGLFFKLAQS